MLNRFLSSPELKKIWRKSNLLLLFNVINYYFNTNNIVGKKQYFESKVPEFTSLIWECMEAIKEETELRSN